MKIYPCNHNIYNVDKVDNIQDIAIGYLDSGFVKTEVEQRVESAYKIESKTELIPYSTIKDLDIALFDKYNDPISNEYKDKVFTRTADGEYLYKPCSSLTFNPMIFTYKVLAKKNIKYVSSREYNINIGCSDIEMSKDMIQYFSDSYKRNLCPTNITFNNGDIKLESLTTGAFENKDIILIKSDDGKKLSNGEDIDIDLFLDKSTIPFIICDTDNGSSINNSQDITFNMTNEEVINTKSFTTNYYFNIPVPKENEIIHNLFDSSYYSPIIIKEIINKGFVVYCSNEFISRLSSTYDIFYETLMNIYMNGYVSTNKLSQWITDEMPNYIFKNGRLIQKERFTSHLELYKILGLMEGDVSPVSVIVDPQNGTDDIVVYYAGMRNDFLVFKKLKTDTYADPVKSKDQISIYTERKNIIYFDEFIYRISNNIENKIKSLIDGNTLYVTLSNFKNSNLNSTGNFGDIKINIDINNDLKQNIYLVWIQNERTAKLQKTISNNDVLLCTITITKEKEDSKLFDMRRRGGGLPDNITNYNCLDIGNVLGRPYRKGGSLITNITMPKKYEYMKEKLESIITDAINKNKSAGDYLVLKLEFK